MSVKLRVSENAKGEIILPVINDRRLKANTSFVLSDTDYQNTAVQMAINSGVLIVEYDSTAMEKMENPEKYVDVLYNENLEKEIKKLKKEIKNPKVKIKVNQNLEIEDLKEEPLLMKNNEKNSLIDNESKLTKKIPPEIKYAKQEKVDKTAMFLDLDELTENDKTKTKMMAWDVENQKMLDKDESLKAVKTQHNSIESEMETQIGNIDFSDEKFTEPEIIEKPVKEKKEKIKIKVKKETGKIKTKKGIKAISPIGDVKPEVKANELGDVEFLDIKDVGGVTLDPDTDH